MYTRSLWLLAFMLLSAGSFAQLRISRLLTEQLHNPIAVASTQPRFSWQLESASRNAGQSAYEIVVTEGKNTVWKSGRVNSDQSVMVPYQGETLKSRKKYNWKLRVWDEKGKASGWSAPASFEMALLDAAEWKAKWITPGYTEDSVMRPSPLFLKKFDLSKKIASARLYITSHGLYEAMLNGQRVGDDYLTPGWTAYRKRLQYQVYDVTGMLQRGSNAIGVTLGSGWYRGAIGWVGGFNFYGKDIALLAQMHITYADGTETVIVSDESWKSSTGKIRYSEIYHGETIDARLDKAGWSTASYNDAGWSPVVVKDFSKSVLISTVNETVKKQERFKPIKIFTTPEGDKVIDFGQNLVGWVVVKVKGKTGDSIILSHAEVLDKKGNFYTANMRSAKVKNTYVLKGGEEEIFEPHFTWQGFRYAKIEGYPGEITADNFEAVALYSDMEPTGTFTSSNALVNQLQHNIEWGQRGNFLDVPTDCPQRDERLGWTGDAQAFARTASFNMNVNNFFAKWLRDVEADQDSGKVPFVVPNVLGKNAVNSAGWADVATIAPWDMYLAYGDKRLLETQYQSMKDYVESIRRVAKNDLWNTGFHFGDWLFYRPNDDNDGRAAVTDKYLIAQCFYAHSVQLLANAAKVLGRQEDAGNYTALSDRIKAAFLNEYMTSNGRLVSGTQTAYVLALHFDMLPENLRAQAAKRLAENVESYGTHLTTGFLGTPYLCHVLSRFGYADIAYKLLQQETYPSWLYPVKMGATTIWERWDGIKPDSTFQTPSMNSYNHYAYGAIGDWMYRVMAGLDTYEDGVGYKHIRIKPVIGGDFTHAEASLKTYYGLVKSGWKLEGNKLLMNLTIPVNTRATVYIPAEQADSIRENGVLISGVKDIKLAGRNGDYIQLELGAGEYHFSADRKVPVAAVKN
ncbi:family 78 glycoside hydrolase catalytic domain [Flavihumibacter stibioxidans]|uniref:alpha-L-rhamnosidase n=1 Tax=Flavihumibacter stibioxidans TaxID=1834163 RepID=A0ABR7MBG5_9BACT|nr:alpha-L-rhamnosidase [Flavihumibacter stibioxidans]MBC6491844.1 alpha-L-rhamnosidase [Flavihumibacter stibioxidans]